MEVLAKLGQEINDLTQRVAIYEGVIMALLGRRPQKIPITDYNANIGTYYITVNVTDSDVIVAKQEIIQPEPFVEMPEEDSQLNLFEDEGQNDPVL